jgi:outer membrane protein TolC
MTGSAALELSLDLPKLLGGYPRLSRLEADKAAILLAIAKKEAARDVTAEYYRLYVLTAKRADYTAAGGYFDAQINDVEHLGKQGLDVKLDLLRSDLKRRSLAAEAVALDAEIAGSLMTLNSAAGAGFKTDDFAFTDIPQPASGAVSGATVSSALETRLDELEAGSAGEAYRQSAYAAAPSFTLGVSRSLRPIDPATELYRTYAAVNLDIFGFGQREAERRSLLGEWEYQKGLAADNRRKLELEKSRLSSEMDNAALACLAARANLFAAEKSLETSKEYYRQGKLKETDLLDIFSDYFSIKELALDSLGQYLDRLAGLGYYKD